MKVALTGGIACGKSLLSLYLNRLGIETVDADDIVHELVPADERRRLARTVFADPAARRALESRLHPVVRRRILEALDAAEREGRIRIAVVPLLFEVHWDGIFDIICCVRSSRELQISRMTGKRGYTREEAEARLAAQLPVDEKAGKSHYVIDNDGTAEGLMAKARDFADWLKRQVR